MVVVVVVVVIVTVIVICVGNHTSTAGKVFWRGERDCDSIMVIYWCSSGDRDEFF